MAAAPCTLRAQLPQLPKPAPGQDQSKPNGAEKPEDALKRLQSFQQEAREALARLEGEGVIAALPQGIQEADLEERRRDLEQMILTTGTAIKGINAVAEARKELENARTEDAAWTGFKEPPPYPVTQLDELLNERDAVRAKLSSQESSLANYERLHGAIIGETKLAGEAVDAALAAVQKATNGNGDAAKWRLESARGKSRLLAARAGSIQTNRDSLRDQIAASKIELARLDRQAAILSANIRFSDEDFALIRKISDERKAAAQREITAVSKRLKSVLAERAEAQKALDAVTTATPPGEAQPAGLEMAKFRVEVADGRIESLQSLISGLESLVQLENLHVGSYQDRRVLMQSGDPIARDKALAALNATADRLRAWVNVIDSEEAGCGADLGKIESRAAAITDEDPRFDLLNEQRAARSEKLAMLRRVSVAVTAQRKLVRRWIAEHTPDEDDAGWGKRLGTATHAAWGGLGKVWAFKMMSFEEKVEVDGESITGTRHVTLGMLVHALLFFAIGYLVASRIARRIQRMVVARGRLAEAQANTLRNWAMIVIGAALLIGTLSVLKIPLTVFAFLGGALAIGVGFGTQTLIKNFISGIIVLVERKVRVGDVLDVEGIVGTVVEINTRSSVIRGGDDLETIIPNSMFLENRVTSLTLSSAKVRRSVRVGAAYGTSPQLVMDILREAAARHGLICKEPAPFAVFDDFGDNALMFTLYFWVDLHAQAGAMIVASDLRLMIEKRFTEAGVGIPYPQRDMHLTTDRPIQVEWAPRAAPEP